jgi:Cu2+-exporting ATPase
VSNLHVVAFLAQGHTAFHVVIGVQLSAVFGLKDSLRLEAAATVAALHGVSVSIISGDDNGAVRSVAAKLGICSPADKRDYMAALAAADDKEAAMTLFCSDGANDAIALAQATIGVHINGTSDVMQSVADTVLLHPSLACVLLLMGLSRAAVCRITINFARSFTYSLFAILLQACAFVKACIPPEDVGLAELVSVLPVGEVSVGYRLGMGMN